MLSGLASEHRTIYNWRLPVLLKQDRKHISSTGMYGRGIQHCKRVSQAVLVMEGGSFTEEQGNLQRLPLFCTLCILLANQPSSVQRIRRRCEALLAAA